MAISVIILLLSLVILIFFVPRSRYALPFFLMASGICVSLIAVLQQNFNFTNYSPPDLLLMRRIDMALYHFIGGFRVSIIAMQGIRLLGMVLYQYGVFTLTYRICQNIITDQPAQRPRPRRALLSVMAIAPVVTALFYSSFFAYRLFLYSHVLSPSARAVFASVIHAANAVMHALLLLYIFVPFVLAAYAYHKKKLSCFVDTVITLLSLLGTFNFIFYYFFFTGPFDMNAQHALKAGFWYFSEFSQLSSSHFIVLPLVTLLTTVSMILNKNRVFDTELISTYRSKALGKNIEELNKNLKEVFHSEKNLMFSLNILSREIKQLYGTPEGYEKLLHLEELTHSRIESITRALKRICELHITPSSIDLREVADEAVKGLDIPPSIELQKRYCASPALCSIDTYHTSSAIANLISNSIDELMLSERTPKTIRLSIQASREWVCLKVRDNGGGIERRAIKQVIMPFFTTKPKLENWGIGLPYVYRVVSAQLGQMRIRSSTRAPDTYTEIDIMLPKDRRRKK